MYLFKCKCGCLFTIKGFPQTGTKHAKCNECGNSVSIYRELDQAELADALAKSGMTMQIIPENAKITVTFDA